MKDQVHPINLDRFITGELEGSENNAIIDHLADCDFCLYEVERLWEENLILSAKTPASPLDLTTAKRLERTVLQRIHRSELAGVLFRLSIEGAFAVLLAFFRALFGIKKPPARKGERNG
jgi:hypothetical protein